MHEAEIHWVKAAFWSSFNHLMQSVVSSCLQAIPSLSQSRHQLTDRKQADPCALSSTSMCCCLATLPELRDSQEYGGALALRCPFFQHFLFNSGFIESILIKNSRDGAWSLNTTCLAGLAMDTSQKAYMGSLHPAGAFVTPCSGPDRPLTSPSNLLC